jgi:Ca2+-transporting ATPase
MSKQLLDSLLKALTLAMSVLPEEIPVAFTTFMAIGAWRLMKMGIVVKQMKTVETLGSATVICTDKTGTITENKMTLARIYNPERGNWELPEEPLLPANRRIIELAMWASEPIPFDPMEQALHRHYDSLDIPDERPDYKMVHEYPLGGKPPMMTHVFENGNARRIIAAKGAPEAIWEACNLSAGQVEEYGKAVAQMAADGYRVLGVAHAVFEGSDFPEQQADLPFVFRGLVAFHDPPKQNIGSVLEAFYRAGISVKIITGDNAETTRAIAKQVGFRGFEEVISGPELMKLDDKKLSEAVDEKQVFTRMFPDAKLKVINALKAKGQVVAMTGDGVNDGPALKAAHIGIAMGKRGTGVARQAASLVLADDDLARMVDAVAMGRRIYTNLKKAIQYIISIHIPIILTVFVPLALGWIYPNIFTPVHIIFMELVMGPTCSIVYENEPIEKNAMQLPPRPFTTSFFSWRELSLSIIQGLAITAGSLWAYQYAAGQGYNEALTRTMTFVTLISANIFLSHVNRSFYYSFITTLGYKNRLMAGVILATVLLLGLMLYLDPVTRFFGLQRLSFADMGWAFGAGFLSVVWFEGYKWWKRTKSSD